jgi:hypothetical protein
MDIIGGISAATEGLKLVNELRKIDKEVDKAELKLRLVELADKLLDAKQALQEAQERQFELISEIKELKAQALQRARLRDFDGLLFEMGEDGAHIGEPYCNQCYIKEEKLFRLIMGPFAGGSHRCSNCGGVFGRRPDWGSGGLVKTGWDPLDPYGE